MNERINELIEEADIQFAMESIPETGLRFEGAMVSRVDLKNLAELLVRECADIAKHHVMNISTYADADFVAAQIKQHFGVE